MQRIQTQRADKNIFIVSSDFEIRLLLSKELSQYGYQIFEFGSISHVLPFLKIKQPDVCILHSVDYGDTISLSVAELIVNSDKKCLVVFLLPLEYQKEDFETRLKTIRMGGNKIYYLESNFLFTRMNELLKEIDDFLDIQFSDDDHILYIQNEKEFNDIYIQNLQKEKFNVDVYSYKEVPSLLDKKNIYVLQELYFAIILNLYYPSFLGVELASLLRQYNELKYIPIIFISQEQNVEKYLYTIRKGGDAYLIHPVNSDVLITTIYSYLYRYKLFKMNLEKDLMTNLYNHNSLLRKLEIKIDISKKSHQSFAFCLIDIDKFKKVNDRYGHQAGDQVIMNLARFLKHNLRNYDVIGRYGGEEFGIILNIQNKKQAMQIMDRIRKNFSVLQHHYNTHIFNCTISIGISIFPDFSNASELINAADLALYKCKEMGRNRVFLMDKE